MPDNKDSTDLVIDAFAFTGRAPIYARLDVDLTSEEADLLTQLVRNLSYLGRAESWVSADVVEESPTSGEYWCVQPGVQPANGEADFEPVKVLAPQSAENYLLWRQQQLDTELEFQLRIDKKVAREKGKEPPKNVSKKSRATLDALLPDTVVDALYVDTAELQKEGWSQPPGTQWVTYWLPRNALSSRSYQMPARRRVATTQAILFSLSSNTAKGEVLPPFKDALLRGELFHAAAIKLAAAPPPAALTGKLDGQLLQGHRHVHYMPLCLHRQRGVPPSQRRIDHVLAWSADPLPRDAIEALVRVTRIFHGKLPEIFVSLVGTGTLNDFRTAGGRPVHELGPGRVWVSSTPFVPPRFLKASSRNSLGGQVVAELTARGFPEPVSIEVEVEGANGRSWVPVEHFWEMWRKQESAVNLHVEEEGRPTQGPTPVDSREQSVVWLARDWRHFRRVRLSEGRKPPVAVGVGLRIVFDEVVPGPICIGYGSHYGLGVMKSSSLGE